MVKGHPQLILVCSLVVVLVYYMILDRKGSSNCLWSIHMCAVLFPSQSNVVVGVLQNPLSFPDITIVSWIKS